MVKNRLILPCEIAVKSVIPAIKATIAKELVEIHGLKQDRVAEILGVTQSAVSKYTRQVRGHVITIDNVEGIQPLIDNMIKLLIDGSKKRNEFLALFCQMCIMIRENGLMCSFCQKTDQRIRLEDCSFCLAYNPTLK
jgi:predicted transcriptional regulator